MSKELHASSYRQCFRTSRIIFHLDLPSGGFPSNFLSVFHVFLVLVMHLSARIISRLAHCNWWLS